MLWSTSIDWHVILIGAAAGCIVAAVVSLLFSRFHFGLGKRAGTTIERFNTANRLEILGTVLASRVEVLTGDADRTEVIDERTRERVSDDLVTICLMLKAWDLSRMSSPTVCNRCGRIKVPTLGIECDHEPEVTS